MSIITDTITGTSTPTTIKDTIEDYISAPSSEGIRTYKPDLDFRLKLEISGANVLIEDNYQYRWEGLDMDFDIVKSYEQTPQESQLIIYNLSTSTYNKIYNDGQAFRLSCARGKDDEYTAFYTGYGVSSRKLGGKIVLTQNEGFMAQDANAGRAGQNDLQTIINLRNYGMARLYKSYQSAVSTDTIIEDCRIALGLPKGNMDKIKSVKKPAGYTIRGDVYKTLLALGNELGFNCNYNDMQFNIYDKRCSDMKTYGIILTPENSNTPERQSDKFKTTSKVVQKKSKEKGLPKITHYNITRIKQGFKIETMLLPFLQVGSTCYLDFDLADARGSKYIYKIEHKGSNTGTDCTTTIYCA